MSKKPVKNIGETSLRQISLPLGGSQTRPKSKLGERRSKKVANNLGDNVSESEETVGITESSAKISQSRKSSMNGISDLEDLPDNFNRKSSRSKSKKSRNSVSSIE
jgi:hypothetical protein